MRIRAIHTRARARIHTAGVRVYAAAAGATAGGNCDNCPQFDTFRYVSRGIINLPPSHPPTPASVLATSPHAIRSGECPELLRYSIPPLPPPRYSRPVGDVYPGGRAGGKRRIRESDGIRSDASVTNHDVTAASAVRRTALFRITRPLLFHDESNTPAACSFPSGSSSFQNLDEFYSTMILPSTGVLSFTRARANQR